MRNYFVLLGFYSVVFGAPMTFALDQAEPTSQGQYQVSANWSELKRGWNTLSMEVSTSDNRFVDDAAVTVVYDMVAMPMTPPEKPVIAKGNGQYEKRIFLGMNGEWKFDTTISKENVEDIHSKTFEVKKK